MILRHRFTRPLGRAGLLFLVALSWNARGAEANAPVAPASSPRTNRARLLQLNPPAPPRLDAPLNDLALFQHLESEGARLVANGRTLTNWSGLLEAKACSLDLPKARSRKLSPTALARRIERATVVVGVGYQCGKCSQLHFSGASGFFIHSSGALVTCRHVLANTVTNGVGIAVMTRDGRVCGVRQVLAVDPLHDLVVLQVEGPAFDALPLARRDAEAGTPVMVVSNPSGHYYAVSTGVVARRSEQMRPAGRFQSLSITADFAKGSSGAPVCDETGSVIGVVDNTQSIYYTVEHDQQQNFQMAVKNCSPVGALLRLTGHAGSR